MKKSTEKKPIETTWKELPKKERERLWRDFKRDARVMYRDACGLRKQADDYERKGYTDWADQDRASAKTSEDEVARFAAIADLIKRNI